MPTLGEFHSDVSQALARGSSLDTVIPKRVRQAVRWLERNYTFQYMRRFLEGTIDLSVDRPNRISLYELRPKAIESLRLYGPSIVDGQEYNKLRRIDPEERSSFRAGQPSAYWLDGTAAIVMDATPEEAYLYQLRITQFTAWPTSTSAEHWLLDNAEDALLATTLWYTAMFLRDQRLLAEYKLVRDEALQTLNISEQDIQHNDRDTVMLYAPTWDERDFTRDAGRDDGT